MNQGLNLWGWFSWAIAWGSIIGLTVYCFYRVFSTKKKPGTIDVTAGGRDYWASRFGLIMAMAGNAIGLGNFLRFPAKAAANGGGAFLIPYFCALIFLGIPMMWTEWAIGRYGGARGHGSTPGMLGLMWNNRAAKYIGAFGIFLPFTIAVYYLFIESWTLAFSFFSGTGKYFGATTRDSMGQFLRGYQGVESNSYFSSLLPALIFLVVTLAINYYFNYKGISKGIEKLAKYGMPILFIFGIILAIRVLTMGTPDPAHPEWNIANGMGFMWNPDFSKLTQASVWLVAAGQIFFTLSLGQGMINTYASYVREKDDIALNGLSTSVTNEFAEVVLGGTIAIPVAVAFFGLVETKIIAHEGAFNLGFQSLPVIFQKIPLGQIFGAMWFLLLFIAGITSSVAMTQPLVTFMQDEFKWTRKKAVNITYLVVTALTLVVVFLFKYRFLDELDFWVGTLGIVIFAVLEIIIFSWIFGVKKGWQELHKGADIKVPTVFKFILKYITPVYLLVILGFWTVQDAIPKLLMKFNPESSELNLYTPQNKPYLWLARGMIVLIIIATLWMIRIAFKKKRKKAS